MSDTSSYDVAIIGGGLAGLTSAILLSRRGLRAVLVEKKSYPFHRVCGEYISNEVLPFLERHDLFPSELMPTKIDRLLISSASGRSFSTKLDQGGFGISRYAFDAWLAAKATDAGVHLITGTIARDVKYREETFFVETSGQPLEARLVIAAQGKRSGLDQALSRPFIRKRSPYVGVKYHARSEVPEQEIALHNFPGGYCGIDAVENGVINVCYLIHRDLVRFHGSIEETERRVLFRNPHLRRFFETGEFLFDRPLVINEISFEKKEPVWDHLLMSGDAAGMITPLCGNGMAMAIHSAFLLSELIAERWNDGNLDRPELERSYRYLWDHRFARRLWAGRRLQGLFGSRWTSELAVLTGKYMKPVAQRLIRLSHGRPF